MSNPISNTSFYAQNPYQADMEGIQRQRAMSQALLQQSMQPIGQQAPGVPVSWTQGLAKVLKAKWGREGEEAADEKQRSLGIQAQSEYGAKLAEGLRQMRGTPGQTIQPDPQEASQSADYGTPQVEAINQPAQTANPEAAMATFGQDPRMAQFVPMAQEAMQRKAWLEALRGGEGQQPQPQPQGQNPMVPGQPGSSVMAGSGTNAPTTQPMPQNAPQGAGGANLSDPSLWLGAPKGAEGFLKHLGNQGEAHGAVQYDQNGDAFVLNKGGQMIRLQGVKSRDKGILRNTGSTTDLIDEYSGQVRSSTPNTLTPEQRATIPMAQQRQFWETGIPAAGMGGQSVPGGTPSPQPRPQPVQVPGQSPLNIPPKDRAKLEADRPQSTFALTSVLDGLGRAQNQIDKLMQAPGLSNISGPIAGRTPNLIGDATNAQSLLDSLKSMISVQELQRMRDASKTGGAVGNVTEKEWPRLEAQLGALQQAQTTEEFRKNLGEVRETMHRMQQNAKQAYEMTYGKFDYKPPAGQPSEKDPLGIRR